MRFFLIGQICRDEILIGQGEEKKAIGGSVFYVALTLKSCGGSPIVLTKLNPSDHRILKPFMEKGVQCHWWISRKTTSFRNVYDGSLNKRRQYLLTDADPMSLHEIDELVRGPSCIVAAPLTPRFLPEPILKHLSEKGFLINLSLQGYLRNTSEKPIRLMEPENLEEILASSRMVILDRAEAEVVGRTKHLIETAEKILRRGPEEVIITDGSKGGLYYSNTEHYAYTVPKKKISLKDPTGAGDIFMACYLFSRSKSTPPRPSIRFAVDTTSDLLNRRGKIFDFE